MARLPKHHNDTHYVYNQILTQCVVVVVVVVVVTLKLHFSIRYRHRLAEQTSLARVVLATRLATANARQHPIKTRQI
jgi:uncharacterized membrane protein